MWTERKWTLVKKPKGNFLLGCWVRDSSGYSMFIPCFESDIELNISRIVTAVNCHEELVGLAKKWRDHALRQRDKGGTSAYGWMCEADLADEALAKAGEEK